MEEIKKSGSQNSSTPINPQNKIDVRAKLAETAGVSTDTYSKGKKILKSDDSVHTIKLLRRNRTNEEICR